MPPMPGAVPGARIENNERPLARIDRSARGRNDPHQGVIDRLRQRAPVEHEFGLEAQHMRRLAGVVLEIIVAALAQHVEQ